MSLNKRTPYLNNKDLLREIHLSKNTYSSFLNPKDHQFDLILPNINKINQKTICEAKRNRADRLAKQAWEAAQLNGIKSKLDSHAVDWKKIPKTDLVFRIITWDHIPLAPGRKRTPKVTQDHHARVNFPPFQHFKFNEQGELICVGKSHWVGGLQNGHFSKDHGNMTPNLARMFIKLCERYGSKGNWRGYCVDETTEALTQRGWLTIDEIKESDKILSYSDGYLKWSKIHSIFRDQFDGLMHKITSKTGIDMLVTPGHKLVTNEGLVRVEYLKENNKVILMGYPEKQLDKKYTDEFVELAGWIVTEGNYQSNKNYINLWQNKGPKADRIRNCLKKLGYSFTESNNRNICFCISVANSKEIKKALPEKNLNMDFILALTTDQRQLLIETMIDGDGWRVGKNKRYVQKSKNHIDLFQALCAISGIRTNSHFVDNHLSFSKPVSYYNVNLFSQKKNQTNVECLDFYRGKRNGRNCIGKGKLHHPNEPTTYYKGQVWCPKTDYGSFMARRNGTVYLTGNTYNDEMQNQALLQLSQVGLQFDESKSNNPFAYYTATITNSFTRILNVEKRNQSLRDDILEMNSLNPSYTRQIENDIRTKEIAAIDIDPTCVINKN